MTLRALRLVATSTKSWRSFPRTTRPILSKPDLSQLLNWPPYRTPSGPRLTKRSSLGHEQQPGTFNTLHRRPGSAAPVGLNSPLEQNLQDKILQGEYIDFSLLLPDSLARPQAPDIQLRVDDSIPGSSPVTMVHKRKPVMESFHK